MKYFGTRISDNMAETPEGYLLCLNVSIGRTGSMEYGPGETPLESGSNGIVIVDRSENELFSAATIASFEGKPLTIKHPENFVGPDNWSSLAKGVMQNVRRGSGDQGEDLVCDLLITDGFTISLVKNGLRELSCGYEAEYIQTGEGKGKQTTIVGNHLALVEEGRAGPQYAVKDHEGVKSMKTKTLGEKLKAMLGKAVDESMKDEEAPPSESKPAVMDEDSYDELLKAVKDLGEKVDAMKPKSEDEEKADKEDKGKDDKADGDEDKDKSEDDEAGLEERLKKLEVAVAKLLEGQSGDEDKEDESEDEEGEVIEDEREEKAEDEEGEMVGDTKSRAEILSPGIAETKDIKVKALKAAYGTKDGKRVIDALTGGKSPSYEDAKQVDTLFIAASELLKTERSKELSKTKTSDFKSFIFDDGGFMTPEKMNEINAKKYGKEK